MYRTELYFSLTQPTTATEMAARRTNRAEKRARDDKYPGIYNLNCILHRIQIYNIQTHVSPSIRFEFLQILQV